MIDLSISWNPNPIIIEVFSYPVRWYSIFWMIAIISGAIVVHHIFKVKKLSDEEFSRLFIYSFCGIIIGARLGHCIFYDPTYYINHPLEIFLPIKFLPNNRVVFTGYAGLASHGGTLGLLISLYLFHLKSKIEYIVILDIIAIAAPLSAAFIRIANFMNSEIIGVETTMPWGVIFEQVDYIPRHPAQLYEAIAYIVFFIILCLIYKRKKNIQSGFYLGLCIFMIFTFRFLIEFLKERQVDFENNMPIDMGQILSIPFIICGLYLLIKSTCKKASSIN